ncbi:MAG TPA: hypothetical protein VH560_16590 [Polyangia bacterium]|jgi:hypothetical protein|nr:hypothetical protein [Polyangia bacterium]
MKATSSIGAKVRTLVGGILLGCALPGVALAGTVPTAGAAPSMAAPTPPPAYAPPPPPAYGAPAYVPPYGYPGTPGYPPSAYFAAPRMAVLEAQIGELEQRRDDISLAPPVTVLVVGGAMTIVGLAMIGANVCSTDDYGNQTDPNCVENDNRVGLGATLLVLGGIGVVAGTVSTIIRGARRRHLARQIAARQLEVNALRGFAPRVDFKPAPSGGGGGTFSFAFDF